LIDNLYMKDTYDKYPPEEREWRKAIVECLLIAYRRGVAIRTQREKQLEAVTPDDATKTTKPDE
jgi:hypothetical protein